MLIQMIHGVNRQAHGDILAKLAELVDAGAVKPLLDDERFAFDQVRQAYARLASGRAIGKVVVEL